MIAHVSHRPSPKGPAIFTDDDLRTLLQRNQSSPRFHERLCDALCRTEFDDYVQNLQPDKSAKIVDYLDKVLDNMEPPSVAFRQILEKLQGICTYHMFMPSSHVLSSDLLKTSKYPFDSGGFSDVFQGTYAGSQVCIKRLRIASTSSLEKIRKMLYREALVWRRLKHSNIVPFIGVTLSPLQIISEWMPSGNLIAYIRSNPDADKVALLADVARGLHYLHLCDVVHGDLKGVNIMVDASGHAQITDFGLSQNQNTLEETHVTAGGTPRWTAPEILEEKALSSKGADVFSFAMVMIEVFTGAAPFNSHPSMAATLVIMQGERPPRPTHPALTDELWVLMQRCWHQDPQLRPEMSEVLSILQSPKPPPVRPSAPDLGSEFAAGTGLRAQIGTAPWETAVSGPLLLQDNAFTFPYGGSQNSHPTVAPESDGLRLGQVTSSRSEGGALTDKERGRHSDPNDFPESASCLSGFMPLSRGGSGTQRSGGSRQRFGAKVEKRVRILLNFHRHGIVEAPGSPERIVQNPMPMVEITDQREEEVCVREDCIPYLVSRPIPEGKRLKKAVITVVSKDQGWSGYPADHGTYRNSWTWFELSVGSPSEDSEQKWRAEVARNLHAHRDFMEHVVEISDKELYNKAGGGDVLTVWALAKYTYWKNTVKSAAIQCVFE